MRRFVVLVVLVLAAVSPVSAQGLGLLDVEGSADAASGFAGRYSKRIVVVDNTFLGISGLKDLVDYFAERGWDARYAEDTHQGELFKLAQRCDILYIVTHAGVRERDQQVGFVWRSLLGLKKNILTADTVAAELAGKEHPALVVVAGCQTTSNDSMARAFGGAFIGFGNTINPATAATWCGAVLEKIAGGMTYQEAYAATPPITSWINSEGGAPRLIEPASEAE